MKKMKVVKSRKRFNGEDGSLASIDREPLRDSSGDIVRDSSGEAIMSGGSKKRTESGPKGYLDDDIKPPSEKDDNGIGQRPRPRPPGGPTPVKNVDIDESDRRREERENAKKTQDVDESDRRREQIANLKPSSKPEKKPEKKPEVKPEAKPSGRTAAGKTAEQEEEGRKKFAEDEGKRNLKRLQSKEKEEALEPINPEKYVGMGGLKALHSLAKGFAAREAAPVAGLLGRNAKTGENLVKDMGPVEFAAGKRRMLQNQSGSSEPIKMGAASRYRAEQAKRNAAAKRQKETESDVSRFEGEGGRAMRKGGKVHKYAKGGSVGSASRRGDGIAMRGKTRGKMF